MEGSDDACRILFLFSDYSIGHFTQCFRELCDCAIAFMLDETITTNSCRSVGVLYRIHVSTRCMQNNTELTYRRILDVLATTCLQSNDERRWLNARHSSVLSLSQVAMLMKVVANNSRSTVQLIEIELSKAYLYRALRCEDSDSDSIYCLANVYLAVLYYTSGQYQTAIDHCKLVMKSQDHSQCSSHVVQGELLPKIDEDIDNVLGLCVFYQYVRTAALNQKATKVTTYNSAFTTELFARYIHINYLLTKQCGTFRYLPSRSLASEIQRYAQYFQRCSNTFITDVLVFCLLRRSQYNAADNRGLCPTRDQPQPVMSCQLDTSELVELLQQSAVEHLTKFLQLEAREFGSVDLLSPVTIVTTDFEALYAYKCGEYQRCLQLSMQNVRTLMVDAVKRDKRKSFIFSYQEFIQLMDNNIVSIIALTLLTDVLERDVRHIGITQLVLSLYLMSQCQMKLHHSLTSLAQTLDNVVVARRNSVDFTLDQLLLKLSERNIQSYLVSLQQSLFVCVS